ncbi:helix-turn-helix domain-containing protein [bacterium]|nr:helix-turn-helix domain-containing protein [bacterium]
MTKEIMDVKEIAKYLGFGEKKIYQLVERGEIPVSKIGGQYRFLKNSIDQWLIEKVKATKPRPGTQERGKPRRTKQLLARVKETKDPLERRLIFMGLLTRETEKEGIRPVVVGGNAVQFYTFGGYATDDIDIAFSDHHLLNKILRGWNFTQEGRHWYNQELDIAIESPTSGLSGEELERITTVEIYGLTIYIVGIEDIIIDRLNAYVHWESIDDGRWAKELIQIHKKEIDWKYLEKRAKEERTWEALKKLPPPPEADEPPAEGEARLRRLAQKADQPPAEGEARLRRLAERGKRKKG